MYVNSTISGTNHNVILAEVEDIVLDKVHQKAILKLGVTCTCIHVDLGI